MISFDDRNKTYLIPHKCPLTGRTYDVAILYDMRTTVYDEDIPNTRELLWADCNYCDFSSATEECEKCRVSHLEWFIENFQRLHKPAIEELLESALRE